MNEEERKRAEKLDRLVPRFLDSGSADTDDARYFDLKDFAEFAEKPDIESAVKWLVTLDLGDAQEIVEDYRVDLIRKERAPNTVNRRLATLRKLVDSARSVGLINWNLNIKNEKQENRRDTRGPTTDLFVKLLEYAKNQDDNRYATRDFAILRTMFDLDLRRFEVRGIDLEDLDFRTASIRVNRKGKREKNTLKLPYETEQSLRGWLDVRGYEEGALFYSLAPGRWGNRLSLRGYNHLFDRLGKLVGLRLTPHNLRHTSTTLALELREDLGIRIEEIGDFSGHSSLKNVMIYEDKRGNAQPALSAAVARSTQIKN